MVNVFSADFHFGHHNIIKLCNRPHDSSIEFMDDIITKWNAVVPEDAIAYLLGDIAFSRKWLTKLNELKFKELYIAIGNHDSSKDLMSWARECDRKVVIGSGFYVQLCHGEKKRLVYCTHRPINAVNNKPTICGHVHDRYKTLAAGNVIHDKRKPERGNMVLNAPIINVGVDSWDFKPVFEKQLLEELQQLDAVFR